VTFNAGLIRGFSYVIWYIREIISTNTMYYKTCLIICAVFSVVYECVAANGALEVLIQQEVAKVKADL
jgi:hypothetical protein